MAQWVIFNFKCLKMWRLWPKLWRFFEKKFGALFGAFWLKRGRFLIQNYYTHCSLPRMPPISHKNKIIRCRTFRIFNPYIKWSKNVLELVHCKFIVVAGYKNLIWNPNLWKENIDRKWKPRKVLASSFDFEVLTSSDFQPILSQKYEKHVTQNVWIMDIEWSSKSVSKKEKNTVVKSSQHSAVFG